MKYLVFTLVLIYFMTQKSAGALDCDEKHEVPVILNCANLSNWEVSSSENNVEKAITAKAGESCEGSFEPGKSTKIKIKLIDGAEFVLQMLRVYITGAKRAFVNLKGANSSCGELKLRLNDPATKTKFKLGGVKINTDKIVLNIDQKTGETLSINRLKVEACKKK